MAHRAEAPTPPPPACACTNVSIMQLFHELKQQFPTVPDHVVLNTISSHCHDRSACRSRLEGEAKSSSQYPAASLATRRAEPPPPPPPKPPPLECPNRPRRSSSSAPPSPPTDDAPRPRRPDSLRLARAPPRPSPSLEDGFPLNVSLNLNCRMNVRDGVRRRDESIASLNLTVSTPTAAVDDAFEGNVRITLNPGATTPREPADSTPRSRIELTLRKQRSRLKNLESALNADRARLVAMQHEIRTLKSPPPSPSVIMHLRYTVQHLHKGCQRLTEQLDDANSRLGGEMSENVRTEPAIGMCNEDDCIEDEAQSWQCHVCTFKNQPLLNKCEMCDMPRIILVHTDDEITVQLHPGVNRIARSWIL